MSISRFVRLGGVVTMTLALTVVAAVLSAVTILAAAQLRKAAVMNQQSARN